MKKSFIKIAVCSRSFSKNSYLRNRLLEKYSNVIFNDQGFNLAGSTLIDFLKGSQKAIVGLEKIDIKVLNACPELQVISKYGVGLDGIDLCAMNQRGIRLGWTGGVNRRSVAELTLSNMISLLRSIPVAQEETVNGIWRPQIGRELSGKVVGIVGCGFIGQDLVKLLQPFNCKILVSDPVNYVDFFECYQISHVRLNQLLRVADIVTLHLPLTPQTKNIINKNNMCLMKPSAILINCARGGLIDEAVLKSMLIKKQLAGAALDVFENEPVTTNYLTSIENLIATPHIGGSTIEAMKLMGLAAIEGLDRNSIPTLNKNCVNEL